MPRAITILGLIQVLCLALGLVAFRLIFRFYVHQDDYVTLAPLALFLWNFGLYLIFVPILWVLFATYANRLAAQPALGRVATLLGVVLCVVMIALFLYATIFPVTRAGLPF